MKKHYLGIILIASIVLAAVPIVYLSLDNQPDPKYPIVYTYEIVNVFPHNTSCFTQGLVFENGFLLEGTGLYGSSTLRKVELETGKTVQLHELSDEYFGEGITIFGEKIIQLTWQSQKGFVYDKQSFAPLQEFSYLSEGWGITTDGARLIMSDGSATLRFLDPSTFEIIGQIQVHDAGIPVARLNELEFVDGDVYANIWQEDRIAVIDVQTGQVQAWINLEGLYVPDTSEVHDVLNGIAYDAKEERLFVTGKLWSKLFEITVVPS
ncbi:TPA: glutaminyl-peptide cyclotransferase [Candidatus Bathyarchaeota archaeon]|nr:glutaminyl-peptide cyclotransferase [Candidatus Bathyarchaeota archaeon]HIJ08562.1 glutaminyl-peptide cyclotransferase [Candidatus Bathyarchaeota archaeon]